MNKTCFCGISEHCGYQIEIDMEQHDKVIYEDAYNKAIQDFYDKILNFEDYIEAEDIDGSCLLYAGKDITNMIVKIKNELDN